MSNLSVVPEEPRGASAVLLPLSSSSNMLSCALRLRSLRLHKIPTFIFQVFRKWKFSTSRKKPQETFPTYSGVSVCGHKRLDIESQTGGLYNRASPDTTTPVYWNNCLWRVQLTNIFNSVNGYSVTLEIKTTVVKNAVRFTRSVRGGVGDVRCWQFLRLHRHLLLRLRLLRLRRQPRSRRCRLKFQIVSVLKRQISLFFTIRLHIQV